MTSPPQRLYCYVDETGQDASSEVFIVVAVVSDADQEGLRNALIDVETLAETGKRKWHKSRPARRMSYLASVVERRIAHGSVFFHSYPKPIPYFFPMLDLIEAAIRAVAEPAYVARIFVDGIDRKKAGELTNALRARGLSLELVRSRRDESEPIIRLADVWAGCVRAAFEGSPEERDLLRSALRKRYIRDVKEKAP